MSVYLLNQPDETQLADALRNLLGQLQYVRFEALVAFAVSSGVAELQPELESLLDRGGSIRIVVGVSRNVTSVEGLRLLMELVNKGARVFVFHNDSADNPVFHPKLYLCRGEKGAVLIVGSNNMTGKGLVGNYEMSIANELDPNNASDAVLLASVEETMDKYCDVAGGFSHPLDEKLIEQLETEGYIGSEQRETNRPETSGEDESGAPKIRPKKKLFASKSVPQSTRRRAAKPAAPAPAAPAPAAPKPAAPKPAAPKPAAPARRGPIRWQKKLALSDVQSQTGHPTGGLRLTQAKWRDRGRLINWTTYFRQTLFGGFKWTVAKRQPFVEETHVKCDITILGKNLGVQTMKISDKQSGQAGQSNYTSILHWGNLGGVIRSANLGGKIFRLYGPPAGSNEPFFIEIS